MSGLSFIAGEPEGLYPPTGDPAGDAATPDASTTTTNPNTTTDPAATTDQSVDGQ